MYNALKNKMTSFWFLNFGISSYECISKVEGKEEIYRRNDKVVILIHDEITGKRIYDVIKSLKNWGETIASEHVSFKVTDYVADKYDTMQIIFADMNFEIEWERSSKIDKLQELVSFVYAMQEKGYLLDTERFNNDTCNNISDFISFFKPNGYDVENSNSCIVKYVHYVLSKGGNFDEFYQPIVAGNKICAIKDFPYYMPVIQMCYNYAANGIIPDDIGQVIEKEKRERQLDEQPYYHYWAVGDSDLTKSSLTVTEENDSYTVYSESIKIYKNMPPEFAEFLKDRKDFFWHIRRMVREDFSNVIINFQGEIIGYKYFFQDFSAYRTVFEREYKSQREILEYISAISDFLLNIRQKKHFNYERGKSTFNLEKDLMCSLNQRSFRFAKLEDVYNFVTDDPSETDTNTTMLFFKLLLNYIEKTYGKVSDKKALFEKKEVRYLAPVVAREFCNFAIGSSIDISVATEEFLDFIRNNMGIAEDNLIYDRNFCYNPSKSVPFMFDYEVKSKYGIEIKKGMRETLKDGRRIITFNRRKNISAVENDISSVKSNIQRKIGSTNQYLHFTDISEVIYTTDLSSDGTYLVAGYITTPLRGERITDELLLSFNNKEILQFAGKLMTNFGRFYIPYEQILIDIIHDDNKNENEFMFYADILDTNFEIYKSYADSRRESVDNFFESLERKGYNPNAFVGIDISNCYDIEDYLISKAKEMDTFCDEHQIYYYSWRGMCPVCLKTRYVVNHLDEVCKYKEKIFEDLYAVHYRLDWETCLKVYKTDAVDLNMMEANIDQILKIPEGDRGIILGQDCFIPQKKALNAKKEFIGYIYKSVNMEQDGFSNLKDTEKLENLPRIMSLVRLIMQVEKCMEYHNMSFVINPFGSVFLSKNHKKQVQIVNIEFWQKAADFRNTRKWVYKYVCQILDSDKDIDIKTSDLPKNDIDAICKLLRKYAQELKMYCPIHKIYYRSNLLFCPKCVDTTQLEKMEIEYVTEAEISSRKYFNQGGESTLYHYDGDTIAKVFKNTVNYTFKCKILSAIFSKKEILERINAENHSFRYIIPKKILVDKEQNKILGYVMDERVEGVSISALRDKVEVKDLGFDRKDVFEILMTVGEGIQTLHDKANIYIGDLNGRNILVDKNKNVYFLDFDGMGIENIAPTFFTEEYIDPVSQKNHNITKKDDWYSFAIQAFYYLTFTHPFNGICEIGGKSLEIPEKMERKLSLLGNHRIEVPVIAEPWDWMNQKLKNAFLNIFEGDSRKSILPELQEQYYELYGGRPKKTDNEIIRLNSRFMAKKNDLFTGDTIRVINNYSAICKVGDTCFTIVSIRGSEYNIPFSDCMEIMDILLLEDYPIVFAVYKHRIVAFHVNDDREIFSESFDYGEDNAVINENTLYLSKTQNDECIILQIDFNSSGETNRQKIKFLSQNKTLAFLVQFNSKFMLVKRNSEGKDEIYCNSEKLCDIDFGTLDSKYNILYDDTTKLWLVIDDKGNVITIKSSSGHYRQYKIPKKISDMNVKSAKFTKGILYIPSTECLYITDVNNQMFTKRMECDKLMTPDSRLYNFNSSGFSVVTNYTFYDIYKS